MFPPQGLSVSSLLDGTGLRSSYCPPGPSTSMLPCADGMFGQQAADWTCGLRTWTCGSFQVHQAARLGVLAILTEFHHLLWRHVIHLKRHGDDCAERSTDCGH